MHLSTRYSILRPEFIMERHEKPGGPTEYSCKLQLPCNAPFEKLEGPVCSSMRLAQQACHHVTLIMKSFTRLSCPSTVLISASFVGCLFGCLQEAS